MRAGTLLAIVLLCLVAITTDACRTSRGVRNARGVRNIVRGVPYTQPGQSNAAWPLAAI